MLSTVDIFLTLFCLINQYASGEISSIMVWDLDKEQLVNSVVTASECSVSALVSSTSSIIEVKDIWIYVLARFAVLPNFWKLYSSVW